MARLALMLLGVDRQALQVTALETGRLGTSLASCRLLFRHGSVLATWMRGPPSRRCPRRRRDATGGGARAAASAPSADAGLPRGQRRPCCSALDEMRCRTPRGSEFTLGASRR